MGFLDNLVKKSIKNTINDVTKSAQRAASDTIGSAVGNAVTNSLSKALGIDPSQVKDTSSSYGSSSASFGAPEQPAAGSGQFDHYIPKAKLNTRHNESFVPETNAIGSDIFDRASAGYFADVIQKNVPGASVQCKVPLSAVSTENPAKQAPIDCLVFINGVPKLAILLPSKNQYRNMPYINTMNACEAAGIPAIRFMQEFNNDPGYVSARVKAVIR